MFGYVLLFCMLYGVFYFIAPRLGYTFNSKSFVWYCVALLAANYLGHQLFSNL